MSTDTKKKKSGATLTQAQKNLLNEESKISNPLGGISGSAGAASSTVPGVTSTESGDVVPFALPHQKLDFQPTAGSTTTATSGDTTMSFSEWVEQIHQLQSDKKALEQIQTQLHAAGYLTKDWANYGTLDSATVTAWKQLGTDAVDSKISAMTLLSAGSNAPNLVTDMQAVQDKITSAKEEAAAVTNSNVTLTDPNEVAQSFSTAMESIGLGTPTQEQTNQFVNAFIHGPQGEIAATQNEADTEKENYMSGAGDNQQALNDLKQGNLTEAQQAQESIGPSFVATKAQPNLDAEAEASAKSVNPDMFYASGTSDLYGLIQKMLEGNLQQPTEPSSPTGQAMTGGIVTAPLVGAP